MLILKELLDDLALAGHCDATPVLGTFPRSRARPEKTFISGNNQIHPEGPADSERRTAIVVGSLEASFGDGEEIAKG